jgi:hypothetical protein
MKDNGGKGFHKLPSPVCRWKRSSRLTNISQLIFLPLIMSMLKQKKANLVFPSETPLSKKELTDLIKEAERGPFYSSGEVKQSLKMEEEIRPVAYSDFSRKCLEAIFHYGAETFSPALSEAFIAGMIGKMDSLETSYLHYP